MRGLVGRDSSWRTARTREQTHPNTYTNIQGLPRYIRYTRYVLRLLYANPNIGPTFAFDSSRRWLSAMDDEPLTRRKSRLKVLDLYVDMDMDMEQSRPPFRDDKLLLSPVWHIFRGLKHAVKTKAPEMCWPWDGPKGRDWRGILHTTLKEKTQS